MAACCEHGDDGDELFNSVKYRKFVESLSD
jgi:hypothetical protein